jgi:quinohemoprotein ethanol dehydrogenase
MMAGATSVQRLKWQKGDPVDMTIHWLACLLALLLVTLGLPPEVAHAQARPAAASMSNDWPSYGRNDAQERYTPLSSINRGTIGRLGLKWALELSNETNLVSTPLMVKGKLFFTGKFSVVYAVDARNGKIEWTFDPQAREELAKVPRRMTYNWGTSRGVAYWNGTIIVATADGRLICLSAKTGRLLWSVQTLDPAIPYLYITGAPLVFRDRVLIGNAGGDFGASRGYVTAYSAADGRQLWRTFTVPGDPARGFESEAMRKAAATWGPQWWKTTGGGNVWNAMTFDPDFNRIYIGTGNGSPWNQKIRGRAGGDNLYVASIIALDADTGEYVWHYQAVPGDNWDYDATEDLVLADLKIAGSHKKVLMQANKNGFFYVIDRSSGKLISAEKFAHVTWADRIDLSTGRPVEAPQMRPVGPSSPVITVWPWLNGAHSWPSMSFSPQTELVYIPGMDVEQIFDARGIDPNTYKPDRVEMWIGFSDVVGRGQTESKDNVDTLRQGAWLEAWDPRGNREVWKAEQPGLWAGGTLTTAGRLVFIGQATGDLAAYDSGTGDKLWHFNCGRPISASPVSYAVDGIQYVAVLAGWGGNPAVEGSMSKPGGLRMTYRDGGRGLFVFALGGNAAVPTHAIAPVIPIDSAAFHPDEDKVKRGEHLFDHNCSYCHGTDALSGGAAPDLRASPLAANRKALGEIVLSGLLQIRGMPQYPDFSDEDVDSIYDYIRWRARKDLANPERASGSQ